MKNIKGIEIVWLSETDLTNLNAGEGGSNYIDVKKYKKNGIEYPYVSGQAMRYYLKEAIRRNLGTNEHMCIPDDKGETCGEIEKCILCDLFGYMIPEKKKGANVRVSPVKVSPAVGLLPFDENAVVDFLVRKKHKQKEEKAGGDIVNVEIGTNLYKCGIAIDMVKVGCEEEIDEKNRDIRMKQIVNEDSVITDRIKKTIDAVKYLSDYSKQARLLTDFTPDVILVSLQNRYNHRLQKAFEMSDGKKLNLNRLEEIVTDVKKHSNKILFGMISGTLDNEDEIKSTMKKLSVEVKKPDEVVDQLLSEL